MSGAFERPASSFREIVAIEPGRYHLYVAAACPWCHRTMLVRELARMQDAVSISYCDPLRDQRGWAFTGGSFVDKVEGFRFMIEAYVISEPEYNGRLTVPVLWDREQRRIVNNESSEIIRMFDPEGALYPAALREEIDAINERVYERFNNGVYRAGFARSQVAYEQAASEVFATLDWLEELLGTRRYLAGDALTEADWRLFPTLVRFDPVYHGHFKCNLRRLVDYPRLWAYTRELFQLPGVAATVELDEIKRHYYMTHAQLNPRRVVPIGPELDFAAPHGRG